MSSAYRYLHLLGAVQFALFCLVFNRALSSVHAEPVNLDHLVPYTLPSAAWSDRYSNIAVYWPEDGKVGLQNLVSIKGWGGAIVTDNLLSWSVSSNGQTLPLTVTSRNYRPDVVVEKSSAENLEITATAAWPERNCIAVEFTLTNHTDAVRDIVLSFDYPGKGVAPDWQGPYPVPSHTPWGSLQEGLHFVSIEGEALGSWSTIYPIHEHGRNMLWVQSFVTGLTHATTMELCFIADLRPRTVMLPPNGQEKMVVALALGRWQSEARQRFDKVIAKVERGWTPAEEVERIQALLDRAPELPAKYKDQPKYERLYAHAITGLNSLFIQGEGGFTGNKRLSWVGKSGLAMSFFWDTSFACVGGREFNPQASQESIECYTSHPTPRGSLPGTLCDSHRAGEGQSPIMSWSAWSVYQRSRDKQWLARVYPRLAQNNRFWFKYHVSARGLCQFFNAGQVADNDARFDPIQGEGQANRMLNGFEAPDLNAFLLMDMKCLAEMARELGHDAQAAQWRQRAQDLGRLIVETMYFPEEAMFYDVKAGTHEKLSGVKGPNMFLPLWAGVPLPQEDIARIIEQHMLNPDEFYRELPFPSLSYDDPKYDPAGYWRGRIWPHVVYWMVQTLWRHGYHEQAEETADRVLNLFGRTPWIHENYGSSPTEAYLGIGAAEYNWSHAAAIELLLERYKEPLP